MNQRLEKLKGHLIVSCQALPHEPLHSSFIMGRMAKAAAEGGAMGGAVTMGSLSEQAVMASVVASMRRAESFFMRTVF